MPLMVPPYIHRDVKSSAERKVFEMIAAASSLEGWVCFHSLGLANHQRKTMGELDFVLLGPWGIICLEVKGGGVSRESGIWKFLDRYGMETLKRESPFEQASGGMFSLKTSLVNKFGKKAEFCRFGYGVVFPDIVFKEESPEWDNQIIFDARDRLKSFDEYIKRICLFWEDKIARSTYTLDESAITEFIYYIRGNFEIVIPLWKKTEDVDTEVVQLTKQQFRALDRMSANPRVFFRGTAGTGKTLLAVECARRMAAVGKKSLFLCFNTLLASKLNIEIDKNGLAEFVEVYSLHKFFLDVIRKSIYHDEFEDQQKRNSSSSDFFKKGYSEFFIRAWNSLSIDKFDCLIVDEGQDLLNEHYFIALDFVLKGGLENGRWYIFYDSNNQGELYHNFDQNLIDKMKRFGAADYYLDINCRNTKPIAIHTSVMSEFKMADTLIDEGERVTYIWYSGNDELSVEVKKAIKFLISNGLKPEDIILLYPGGYSHIQRLIGSLSVNFPILELSPEIMGTLNKKVIYYASIQSFKGLESRVIILIGIDKLAGAWINTLNYVGMSRARTMLFVALSREVEGAYAEKLKGFIGKNG